MSEDTVAIVAAQLTAAHCALANHSDLPKDIDKGADLIFGLFERYRARLSHDDALLVRE